MSSIPTVVGSGNAACKHRTLTSRPLPHPKEGCCRTDGTLSIALQNAAFPWAPAPASYWQKPTADYLGASEMFLYEAHNFLCTAPMQCHTASSVPCSNICSSFLGPNLCWLLYHLTQSDF